MTNPLVTCDKELDALLQETPCKSVFLIEQAYQESEDKPTFLFALIAKLVLLHTRYEGALSRKKALREKIADVLYP